MACDKPFDQDPLQAVFSLILKTDPKNIHNSNDFSLEESVILETLYDLPGRGSFNQIIFNNFYRAFLWVYF